MKSIVKFELDKIIQNKSFAGGLIVSLIVLAGIVFIGFHYSHLNISGDKTGEGMELYHEVVKKSSGDFTDQKVQDILANYIDRFQSTDVENEPSDLFSWQIGEVFFPEDENIYLKINDAITQNEKITIDQINLKTIQEVGFTEFETPLKIGSYVTWYDLYKVMNQLFILTIMITILICSLVFSGDTSRNMNQLLLSTKFGRNKLTIYKIIDDTSIKIHQLLLSTKFGINKLTISKIIAATLISIFVFIFIQIISLVSFYIYNSGFSCWDVSIQTNFSLNLFGFPVELNHLQVFLLFIAFHFISMLSIVGLTIYISSVTRSPFSSLIISLGLFFLPKALTEIFKRGIVYKLLNLFPINNYNIYDFLSLMSSKREFLLDSFMQNIIFTMVVLLIVKVLLDIIVYFRIKKYQVT